MKILFITGHLTNSATGYCAKTVIDELAARGNSVSVVALTQNDESTCSNSGNIEITTCPIRRPMRILGCCRESKSTICRFVFLFLSGLYWISIQFKGWFSAAPVLSPYNGLLKTTANEVEKRKYDCLVAVVNPVDSLKVASRIKETYNIPFFAYYLDSFYGNKGLRLVPDNIYRKHVLDYENKYLHNVDRIYAMNSARNLYSHLPCDKVRFIDKIKFLDIPMLKPAENTPQKTKSLFPANTTTILFVGTMPRRIRDPRRVIDIMKQVAVGNIHFYIAGRSDFMSDIHDAINQNSNIHYLEYIPHESMRYYLTEADFLLNIGNDMEYMLPSKIFEYMSYDKPILSSVKCEKDLSINYLKTYQKAHIFNEDDDKGTIVQGIKHFIENPLTHASGSSVSSLCAPGGPLYKNTPQCFADTLLRDVSNLTVS
ncbi:MAG: glycosyltransferase [Bacteroidaceae bacterium]|nr:glycosyltransferase [Bacteroidaceae bacterium]